MKTTLIIILVCGIMSCMAETHQEITSSESNDTDDNKCVADEKIAQICLKCNSLPFYALPPLVSCCSDKSAFLLCEACVNDQDSCETLMNEIEEVDTFEPDDDYYDDDYNNDFDGSVEPVPMPIPITTAVEKRYGKLFVNRNPKRYGRVFFGKRADPDTDIEEDGLEKRFGRLYMGGGSYFGKRSSMDKRYGRLFTTSKSYFGKRASDLVDDGDDFDVSKRYGRVYMGGRNKLFGKRYGRIFFGKRNGDDLEKRYGQLNIGRSPYFTRYANMDKRFGRLFTGRRKYYFGK